MKLKLSFMIFVCLFFAPASAQENKVIITEKSGSAQTN